MQYHKPRHNIFSNIVIIILNLFLNFNSYTTS